MEAAPQRLNRKRSRVSFWLTLTKSTTPYGPKHTQRDLCIILPIAIDLEDVLGLRKKYEEEVPAHKTIRGHYSPVVIGKAERQTSVNYQSNDPIPTDYSRYRRKEPLE